MDVNIDPEGGVATLLATVAAFGIIAVCVHLGGAQQAAMDGAAAAEALRRQPVQAKAPIEIEGDLASVPASDKYIPNSLGYLNGVDDGLTPQERAEIAAENAEEQRLIEEEAKLAALQPKTAPAEEASVPGAEAASDAALSAAAGAQFDGSGVGSALPSIKPSAPKLGAGAPTRLNGGDGMTHGVTRHFDAAPFPNAGAVKKQ